MTNLVHPPLIRQAVGAGVEFSLLAPSLYYRLSPAVSTSSTHLGRMHPLTEKRVRPRIEIQGEAGQLAQEMMGEDLNQSQGAVGHLGHRTQLLGITSSMGLSIVRRRMSILG